MGLLEGSFVWRETEMAEEQIPTPQPHPQPPSMPILPPTHPTPQPHNPTPTSLQRGQTPAARGDADRVGPSQCQAWTVPQVRDAHPALPGGPKQSSWGGPCPAGPMAVRGLPRDHLWPNEDPETWESGHAPTPTGTQVQADGHRLESRMVCWRGGMRDYTKATEGRTHMFTHEHVWARGHI